MLKYYNEKGPIKKNSSWWVNGRGIRTNTVVLGLTIENNDLLLNDLQIDLINRIVRFWVIPVDMLGSIEMDLHNKIATLPAN